MLILSTLIAAVAQDAPAETEPAAAVEEARTYALDGAKSFLGVLVKYDRNALVAGHDHVVSPSSFEGTVTWGADLSKCDVHIAFPVTALEVDPAGSRGRFSLEGETSDGDKKTIKKNLEGKHQLEAESFPEIAFQSKSCEAKGDKVAVTGTLTMHGVGAPVTALMDVKADEAGFKAKGKFEATHSTWGLDPFTALLGSLRNDAGFSFAIDVTGTPK